MATLKPAAHAVHSSLRCAIFLVASLLAACEGGVLDPKGPVGDNEKLILIDATLIMLAVVIPVILCTIAFAFWFRAKNRHAVRRPDWEYSGRIEFVTWSIPALIVLFLSGIAWISSHDLDPPKPLHSANATLEIEVVSLDWKWLFLYPKQQLGTVNELVIPVGVPVHFKLTSASVMNSFFVPRLGSQIYTMAGMTTQLNLMASSAGEYDGMSAQFSGDGFSDMHFRVRAVQGEEFQQWVQSTGAATEALDEESYGLLARPSQNEQPHAFGHVSPGLFEAIVHGRGEPPKVPSKTAALTGSPAR